MLRRWRITCRPCVTKARLRPLSGTTSHTVASATRSSRASRSGAGRSGAVVAASAQLARRRHQHHEGDARGAQMPQPRQVVLPVGIDDGRNVGQALVGLVVVDDDHVGAERPGDRQRRDAGGAAVDRDDQLGALLDERLDGRADWAHSPRTCGRECRCAHRGRAPPGSAPSAPTSRRRRRRSRRRRRCARLRTMASASRAAPLSMSRSVLGSGISALSSDRARPARRRRPIAARGQHAPQQLRQAVPLADGAGRLGRAGSSRSRQRRPRADASTPR